MALYIVEQQVSLSRDDLKRMMAKQLGFRLGSGIDALLASAIDALVKDGKLAETDETLTITASRNG